MKKVIVQVHYCGCEESLNGFLSILKIEGDSYPKLYNITFIPKPEGNGNNDIYEIDTLGTLVNTYTAPASDCCIVYDSENDCFIGTSRSNNKFYYFDNSLVLETEKDFDWSFIKNMSGPVAMQNCAFDSGVFYAAFRPNSVYAVNIKSLQFKM